MNRLSPTVDGETGTDSHLLWMGKHEQTLIYCGWGNMNRLSPTVDGET